MQKEGYLIKNACYSVTKYYLCKQNNKRSLSGRKQRSQVARSFLNRYQLSWTNNVTSLFSIRYILIIILSCKLTQFILLFIINNIALPNESSNYLPHPSRSLTTDSFRKARSLERC
ncbi:hypothetical protein [Segatella salivae]|uniref:hypothetical protein n=1 Tax=Segatella salivae TaxID=228604 RepID=UPI001E6519C0|nr:hypothetical protein [Segatella salivae]